MPRRKPISSETFFKHLTAFLSDLFSLDNDKANERETIEDIKRAVPFRGYNLWILMFAIMVCSIGLNVNSTAVVIGAMLISPIMGPIMGVGLGVGINDSELILRAMKNLGIALVICVLVSALYFWISPLDEAQSELFARAEPTVFDVLIALFGGLAGIVAASAKEKTNAIPGVAIATALMPPLCTAGYGLATQTWSFFFGALYLFLINSVFISLSTYLIVRLLGYSKKEFLDPVSEKRTSRFITFFALIIIIPSILTATRLVGKSIFKENANKFITSEMQFDNSQVISKKITYGIADTPSKIEVVLYGEPIDSSQINTLRKRMVHYKLLGTELVVRQGYQAEDDGLDMDTFKKQITQVKTGIIEELYKKNEQQLKTKDEKIKFLEAQLEKMKTREVPILELVKEVKAINKNVLELSVTKTVISQVDSLTMDTLYLAYAKFARRPTRVQKKQLQDFIKERVNANKLKLIVN